MSFQTLRNGSGYIMCRTSSPETAILIRDAVNSYAAHLSLIEELTNSLKDTYEMASYVGGARCKEIEDLLIKARALLGGGKDRETP